MKSEANSKHESTAALTATWIALLVFSILNYLLADTLLAGGVLVASILFAVLVKFALVLAVFMELGHRGRSWLGPTLVVLTLGLIAFGLLLA